MRKGIYDGNRTVGWKNGTFRELLAFFADCEGQEMVLERIEVNAKTLMNFRLMGSDVEQASLRDCKKGLFARVLTAEIWLNNKLKDGQLHLQSNYVEGCAKGKPAELKMEIVTSIDDAREWFLNHSSGQVRCEAGGESFVASSFTDAKRFFESLPA